LVRAGSISEGRRLCAAGFDAAAALGDRFVVLEDQLSMAEILLAGGEAHSAEESARKALEDFERTGRKESAWRAWAIVALSRRRLADLASAKKAAQTASDRLMELRAQWGADAFDGYIQRPDLRTLRQGIKP
jgi:16S rRNA G1207 methylase RsmC